MSGKTLLVLFFLSVVFIGLTTAETNRRRRPRPPPRTDKCTADTNCTLFCEDPTNSCDLETGSCACSSKILESAECTRPTNACRRIAKEKDLLARVCDNDERGKDRIYYCVTYPPPPPAPVEPGVVDPVPPTTV